MTESHVVVYCDMCGDIYTENTGESICFDSTQQAVDYLQARSAVVGWVYDGDLVWCDGCLVTDYCERNGHQYPDAWQTVERLSGVSTRSRACVRCGTPEIEALP